MLKVVSALPAGKPVDHALRSTPQLGALSVSGVLLFRACDAQAATLVEFHDFASTVNLFHACDAKAATAARLLERRFAAT